MRSGSSTTVDIDGRQLTLTNLEKVFYPEVGFTKGEVVDYYARIAPTMLTHLGDRCVTFVRFPDGVEGSSFFEKRCPGHRPDWVTTALGPGERRRATGGSPGKGGLPSKEVGIHYCVLRDVPSVVWAANLAAIELHTPMARAADMERPTMVVFDLDPGPPAGLRACAEVALLLHDALSGLGLELFPKTSGSKGLQVYLPLNTPHENDRARSFALAVAQLMEKHHPDLVLTAMNKDQRAGKVLIDWSQNAVSKTTVCAYSLRARPRPTVSTPVTWDEVESAAGGEILSFEAAEVIDRVASKGDLFAPVATLVQELPTS